MKSKLLVIILILAVVQISNGKNYNIINFGARSDSTFINTIAIQKAIDECYDAGGGTVLVPTGNFITGTIFLKSNIHLHLEMGARLIGSKNIDDYPDIKPAYISLRTQSTTKQLIYAEKCNNISITGFGEIDGRGKYFPKMGPDDEGVFRPHILRMIECDNIQVCDITMRNSAAWMQHYLACDNIAINNITVLNRNSNVNNDGIDIDCCKNVRISNCNINSEDDGIVLKSTSNRICENVVITNCILSSHCNALKCGTESNGGFRNISISNCVIYNTYLSGIALEIVDGGIMDLITVNNITMYRTNNPIFIKLGNRARPYSDNVTVDGIGSMKNIQISNILASEIGGFIEEPELSFSHHNAAPKAAAIFISGIPEKDIQNINLENISVNYTGGGVLEDAFAEVLENPSTYPEYSNYGKVRPSYGFYCRHISDLVMDNINLTFNKPDFRPAFIFDQVSNAKIFNLKGERAIKSQSIVQFESCSDIYVETNSLSLKRSDIKLEKSSRIEMEE